MVIYFKYIVRKIIRFLYRLIQVEYFYMLVNQEIRVGATMNKSVEEVVNSNAWSKVLLARKISRFRSLDIINHIFDSFIELHGDRGDRKSVV